MADQTTTPPREFKKGPRPSHNGNGKPHTPRGPEKGIPGKVLGGLEAALKKMGYTLKLEEENTRATVMDGETTIAGPFTHGQSVQAWIDGHRWGKDKGVTEGKAEGTKEGFRLATEKTETNPKLYVVKTGSTFHVYRLVNGQWARVEHPSNPAFSYGKALDAAIDAFKLGNFDVQFEDRTEQIGKA